MEKHIAPRRDGICGNSDGKETAIGLGLVPAAFEFYAPYDTLKQLGWWDGIKDRGGSGFRLEDCIENGHPTWVDLGGVKPSLRLLQENRALIERLTNRIGYHFHLVRATWPGEIKGAFDFELTVQNQGATPIYIPCSVAISSIDETGKRIATVWPESLQPKQWQSDKATKQTANLQFKNVPPGQYRLALALTRQKADAKPFIQLVQCNGRN